MLYDTPMGLKDLLFGGAEALELRLQSSAVGAGPLGGWVQALPYLVTIAALALRGRRRAAPAALGKPLEP